MSFRVSPGIRALPIFVAESEPELLRKYNLQRLIKMAANESCYGPSPLVIEAIRSASTELHRYPDVYGLPLKTKIAEIHAVEPSQILSGNGSTELVEMIAKTFLQAGGDACITAHETFPIYRMAVSAVNASCVTVPLRNDRYDLEAMLSVVGPSTRLVFIANPNNPTGTMVPEKEILHFLKHVSSDVLVVVDEAYGEYAGAFGEMSRYISDYPNLIVLRTFSKIHGLAALRVGYAICSAGVADDLIRASLPYSVNALGQLAAFVALDDPDHVRECSRKNKEQREILQREFDARGYRFVPSDANFILLKVSKPVELFEALLRKGILVARVPHFNVPDGIRITLGLPEENEILLRVLRDLRDLM